MDNRAWMSGASGTAPTAPGSPSTGYPTGGNPGTGTPPTNPGPYWFHQIGEELRAVIVAGGGTPSQGSLNQLLTALTALFSNGVLTTAGTPDGFKIGSVTVQFGSVAFTDPPNGVPGATGTVTFPHAFTTACLHVFPAIRVAGGGYGNLAATVTGTPSTTSFDWQVQEWSSATNPGTLHWLAIGY